MSDPITDWRYYYEQWREDDLREFELTSKYCEEYREDFLKFLRNFLPSDWQNIGSLMQLEQKFTNARNKHYEEWCREQFNLTCEG